jgi:hypothetical protein
MGHDVEIEGTGHVLYISGNFSCLDDKYGGVYRIHGHQGKINFINFHFSHPLLKNE